MWNWFLFDTAKEAKLLASRQSINEKISLDICRPDDENPSIKSDKLEQR